MLIAGGRPCNVIMYPTIHAPVPSRRRAGGARRVDVLCMAVVGGAIVPVATGALADIVTCCPR